MLRAETGKLTKTISVTSGKGGVGKSTIVANLAIQLAQQGSRVLLLDGDLGMANLDIMFGARARHSIHHVVKGEIGLAETLVEVRPNVSLIPGGSGVYELSRMTSLEKQHLLTEISALPESYDYLLVDTAPGIDDNVLDLNAAAHEIVVVLTPDPASLADSYALIKVLNKHRRVNRFSILCNQVRDESEALALYRKICEVADRFLVVGLDYRGYVPADPALTKATRSQQLVSVCQPHASSSLAFRQVSKKLSGFAEVEHYRGGIQFFWQQLLGVA